MNTVKIAFLLLTIVAVGQAAWFPPIWSAIKPFLEGNNGTETESDDNSTSVLSASWIPPLWSSVQHYFDKNNTSSGWLDPIISKVRDLFVANEPEKSANPAPETAQSTEAPAAAAPVKTPNQAADGAQSNDEQVQGYSR